MKLTFIFESDLKRVNLARKICQKFFEEKTDIIIAATEALNNAVLHSGAQEIELEAELSDKEMVVRIITMCKEFDSSRPVKSIDIDKLPEHGFGLTLIHKTVDQIDHIYLNGKNILTLRKFILD